MWDVISAFWLQHAPVLSVLLPVFTAVGLLLIGDSASSGGTGADGRQGWGARLSVASGLASCWRPPACRPSWCS